MSVEASERDPLDRLAEEFVERYRRGERPSVSEYARRYPELASQIGEVLQALVLMEELAPGKAKPAGGGSDPGGAGSTVPQRLGEYRLLREVGRGGMGVVYEAEQESLGRHVALKVLPFHALLDPNQLERFRREARAAAALHHTNIVPVFGVGEEAGVHYYAMQFIQGHGLDVVLREVLRLRAGPATPGERPVSSAIAKGLLSGEFAPEAPLAENGTIEPTEPSELISRPGDERQYYQSIARIGAQVGDALAYAHAQGVLHRDIKPSNLLLDTQGTVWVTDFGLAKTNAQEDLTHTGDIVGTLRYMAPERFDGWSDPRSDVYGLGVTLYEMLTLRPAFGEEDRGRLIKQVTQQEPPPPRQVDHRIPRDLETIVLKAIAREPGRRYATATALADDLRRFLADKPIQARRTSAAEQVWRWSRRNPGSALTSSLALAFLLAGLAAVTWQWRRAEHNLHEAADQRDRAERGWAEAEVNFRRADEAVEQMLTEVGATWLADVPLLEPVRRELLEKALAFCRGFLDDRTTDPEVRYRTAWAYRRAGHIHDLLGQLAEAEEEYTHAVDLYDALAAEFPQDVRYRRERPRAHFFRAKVYAVQRRFAEAEVDYRQAIALQEAIAADSGGEEAFVRLAEFETGLGRHFGELGQLPQAERYLRRGLETAGRVSSSRPAREELAQATTYLGNLLILKGTLDEAESTLRHAIDLWQGLREERTGRKRDRLGLAQSTFALGVVLREASRPADAEAAYRVALQHFHWLASAYPGVAEYWQSLAGCYNDLGLVLRAQNRTSDAEELYRQALTVKQRLAADFPTLPHHRLTLGTGYLNQAVQLRDTDPKKAEPLFRQALDIHQQLADAYPADQRYRSALARTRHSFGLLLKKLSRPAEAEEQYVTAIGISEKLVEECPDEPRYRIDLATFLQDLGVLRRATNRAGEAEKCYRRALGIEEQLVAERPAVPLYRYDLAMTSYNLGNHLRREQRPDDAEKAYRRSAALYKQLADEFPAVAKYTSQLGSVLNNLAAHARGRKDYAETCRLLEEAVRRQRAALAVRPGHEPYVKQLVMHLGNLADARLLKGDAAGAAATARELVAAAPDDVPSRVRAAGYLARGAGLLDNAQPALAQDCANQALNQLRAAVAGGFRNARQLQSDPSLETLRGRDEFKQLLRDLTASPSPQ